MQIFLLLIILILIGTVIHQWKETRELERKTHDAFRIFCKKLKQNTEDR